MSAVRFFDRTLSCDKGHRRGTHRAPDPLATLAAYEPLMPRLGITRLANVTGLDAIGVPVYAAIRPNSRSVSTSQGKGLDVPSERASALMESIEMWHAEHVELPIRWESYRALQRVDDVIDVSHLPRVADSRGE
jgi:ribosomal protein S12 methylthiotransferase accessory factor